MHSLCKISVNDNIFLCVAATPGSLPRFLALCLIGQTFWVYELTNGTLDTGDQ